MRTSILVFLVLGLVAIVLCGPPKKGQPNEREIGKTFNKIKDNLQKQIDGANAAGDTKKVEDLQKVKNEKLSFVTFLSAHGINVTKRR